MAATPIPCLLAVTFSDSIPLEPPERGLKHSQGYWARAQLTAMLISYTVIGQIRYYVPRLRISLREQVAIAFPVATLTIAATFAIALVIGLPVPLASTMLSIPWVSFFMLSLWLVRGRFLRSNPDVRRELRQYSLVMTW